MTNMMLCNSELIKRLQASGLDQKQSEAISDGIQTVREEMNHLARKEDVLSLKENFRDLKIDFKELKEDFKDLKEEFKEAKKDIHDLRQDLNDFKQEVKQDFREIKEEFKDVRTEIHDLKKDLIGYFDIFQSNIQNRLMNHCSVFFIMCTTVIIGCMSIFHTWGK